MKLENQVVSLELAKKLKELGVKQESLFKYIATFPSGEYRISDRYTETDLSYGADVISAFTVAELGEILPEGFRIEKFKDNYWCFDKKRRNRMHWEISETEADARAKCLIYLIENKLINLK